MKEYVIDPFTTKEEKILARESIPFKRKGKKALFTSEKDFARAAFNLMLPFLPKERDFVEGAL